MGVGSEEQAAVHERGRAVRPAGDRWHAGQAAAVGQGQILPCPASSPQNGRNGWKGLTDFGRSVMKAALLPKKLIDIYRWM